MRYCHVEDFENNYRLFYEYDLQYVELWIDIIFMR